MSRQAQVELLRSHSDHLPHCRGVAWLANSAAECDIRDVRPYEEIVGFIASLSPREVVEFQPSMEARERVWDLLGRQKITPLPSDEKAELDHYLEVEHLMRLAKARARQLLAHGPRG